MNNSNENQVKIVKEGDKYVGYVLKDGKIAFRTDPVTDMNAASRSISLFLNKATTSQQGAIINRKVTPAQETMTRTNSQAGAPRKCCGRR